MQLGEEVLQAQDGVPAAGGAVAADEGDGLGHPLDAVPVDGGHAQPAPPRGEVQPSTTGGLRLLEPEMAMVTNRLGDVNLTPAESDLTGGSVR